MVSSWVPESPSFLQQQGRRCELMSELRRSGVPCYSFKVAQEANESQLRAVEERSLSSWADMTCILLYIMLQTLYLIYSCSLDIILAYTCI